jgi:hypothetical protein
LKNKPFQETLLSFCCLGRSKDLNKRENRYYTKFKAMVMDYDHSNPEHERHLQMLYTKVFKREPHSDDNQNGFEFVNDDWKDIGFQGKNPRTDFRGGGHLSLLCLLYMVDRYPADWERLVACTKDEEHMMWLTAISSINLTHSLVAYFYMNTGDVAPQHTKLQSGRTQMKNFCKLNSLDKRCFFEINCFGLKHLHMIWCQKVAQHKDDVVGMMGAFSGCMDETKLVIHEVLGQDVRDV